LNSGNKNDSNLRNLNERHEISFSLSTFGAVDRKTHSITLISAVLKINTEIG
jgi:hypothetical protein